MNSAAQFYYPYGIALGHGGVLFVADTYNHTIRKVVPAGTDWVVMTLAGAAGAHGTSDGTGSVARFYYPYGVAVGPSGDVYVADSYNHTLRAVAPAGTNWVVTTIAGSAGEPGISDGPGNVARFRMPYGVAIDSAGNLFVADTYNHTIRFGQPGFKLRAVLSASQLVLS